ncbi:MAG: hypothetical protein WCS15_02365 [Prevotella sp.]
MTAITISDGTTTVTMPRTDQVTDAGSMVYKETTMASGRVVRKVTGFRAGFTYTYDYVPAATITSLITLLRTGGFFTVGYFDLDGTDKSGTFSVEYPQFSLFKFVNGVAMWYSCTLTITAQGVT